MILTIWVHDSNVDNFLKELNVLDDLTLLRNYQHYYHIQKSSRTFKAFLKLSTELSYTQIVKNIDLFSDIINKIIIYTSLTLTTCVYDDFIDNIRKEVNVLDDLYI
jgi:hypothetical protein